MQKDQSAHASNTLKNEREIEHLLQESEQQQQQQKSALLVPTTEVTLGSAFIVRHQEAFLLVNGLVDRWWGVSIGLLFVLSTTESLSIAKDLYVNEFPTAVVSNIFELLFHLIVSLSLLCIPSGVVRVSGLFAFVYI